MRLGLIASDAVTNLRFALDHLTWQLALTRTKTPFDRTEFPIEKEWGPKNRARFKKALQSVPTPAVDLIQELQPYHRGQAAVEHPLWLLDQLCNIAKHVVVPVQGTMIEFKLPKDDRTRLWMLNNGTTLVFIPKDIKPQVDLAPKPAGGVTFGYIEREIVVNPRQLADIYDFVTKDVIPRFTGFFPKR
jgi:hypothetical protein